MALDSLEKRRNVPGVGRPWMRMTHPVATPDEQWRMSVGLTYGGNALTPATDVKVQPLFIANVGKMMGV